MSIPFKPGPFIVTIGANTDFPVNEDGKSMRLVGRVNTPDSSAMFGKDGMTFGDFLDIINPLQQLPIIGTIYRAVTGDTIKPAARIAGGLLYGGPIGFVASLLDNEVEASTGRDIGGNLVAMVTGAPAKPGWTDPGTQSGTVLAAAPSSTAAAPPAIPGASAAPTSAAAALSAAGAPPATGLVTRAGLPGAGSIVPANLAALTSAQTLPGGTGGIPWRASGGPIQISPLPAPAASAATATATAAPVAAAQAAAAPAVVAQAAAVPGKGPDANGFFAMPPRLNNVKPRMPVATGPTFSQPNPPALAGEARARGTDALNQPPTILSPDGNTTVPPSAAAEAANLAGGGVSDAMQRALDKYDQLVKGRKGAAPSVNQTS